MTHRSITPGTTAVPLEGTLDLNNDRTTSVVLQGHINNTGVIYVGDIAGQQFALEAKDAVRIYTTLKDVYVRGSGASDKVVVILEVQ